MSKGPGQDVDLLIARFLKEANAFLVDAQKKVDALADTGAGCSYKSLADAVDKISTLINTCEDKVLPNKTPRGDETKDTESAVDAQNCLDKTIEDQTTTELEYKTEDQRTHNRSFIDPGDLDRNVQFPCRFFKPTITGAALSMGGVSVSLTGFSAKFIANYDSLTGVGIAKSFKTSKKIVSEIATTTATVENILAGIRKNACVAESVVGLDKGDYNAISVQMAAVRSAKRTLALKT